MRSMTQYRRSVCWMRRSETETQEWRLFELDSQPLRRGILLGRGEQQLISVGIDDLDHVVTSPGLLVRNRALDDFTAKRGESIDGQFHEQARLVSSRGILAKDDLAFRAIDLADLARAVALMPTLLEAEHVDVEPKCTVHVSNEEYGTRVP
jgi:hypothetical protein